MTDAKWKPAVRVATHTDKSWMLHRLALQAVASGIVSTTHAIELAPEATTSKPIQIVLDDLGQDGPPTGKGVTIRHTTRRKLTKAEKKQRKKQRNQHIKGR